MVFFGMIYSNKKWITENLGILGLKLQILPPLYPPDPKIMDNNPCLDEVLLAASDIEKKKNSTAKKLIG